MIRTDVLLVEPPPAWRYGNQRSKGAFGNLKTDIRWPPVDLVVLAGYLRSLGFSVALVDGGGERLSYPVLRRRLAAYAPGVIIVNTSTTTIYHDYETVRICRSLWKDARAGVIGVHGMALPRETLSECPELDFVVYSEPEIPVANLIRQGDCARVKGIAYRSGDGTLVVNPPEPPLADMDTLAIPAHDLVPLRLYREPQMKRSPMAVTMVSRGCINRCTFCSSVFFNHYRVRSVPNVMRELLWLTRDLGVRELKFYDDGITYDASWARELFTRMINEHVDLTWNTNIRADSVDFELLRLMKQAGCHTVNLGLESADEGILRSARKNINLDTVVENVSLMKKAGLEVCAYFVYGLPGETRETMQKTLAFAKKLDADLVTFNIATPHPGTDFYRYLERNGYLKTKDWSLYDTNSTPVYDYPQISGDQIYASALRAYRAFYMRPRYFLKRLTRVASFGELANLTRNFVAFFANFIVRGLFLAVKKKGADVPVSKT